MTLAPLRLLDEQPGLPQGDLPDALRSLYDGDIGLGIPCLYANFVETIDGVVAIPDLERSNALVSDESDADRFVMGLLRALADAVVIGSGTLLSAPNGTWRADRVFPAASDGFAELRQRLAKTEHPTVAIVTAGGSFDPTHPVLTTGAIVLTTEAAAAEIRATVPAATEVVAVNAGEWVDPAGALAMLRDRGHLSILSEGGPTLFTSLLAAGLVDELFVTVSPLLAGRSGVRRLSLADGVELLPDLRVEGDLLSIRRHGSHLFLRYGLTSTSRRA